MSVEYEDSRVRVGLLAAEAPPKRGIQTGSTAAIRGLIPALREQAGTWFRIAEYASPTSASTAGTRYRKEPWTAGVEFQSHRNDETQTSVLYARWVGK